MPKISITLQEVKQIISEKYFKKHDISPNEISIYDGGIITIQTIDDCETISDQHYIFSFEIEGLNF